MTMASLVTNVLWILVLSTVTNVCSHVINYVDRLQRGHVADTGHYVVQVVPDQPPSYHTEHVSGRTLSSTVLDCLRQRARTRLGGPSVRKSSSLEHPQNSDKSPCLRRVKRHKKQSLPSDSENLVVKNNTKAANKNNERLINATCQSIATFLLNSSNLEDFQKSVRRSECSTLKQDHLMRKLTQHHSVVKSDAQIGDHRSEQARKWRHLSCRTYRMYSKCLEQQQEALSLTTTSTAPTESPNSTPPAKDKASSTRGQAQVVRTPEAVHVSDPSRIDYMPFMIGDSKYWADEYEMWFY